MDEAPGDSNGVTCELCVWAWITVHFGASDRSALWSAWLDDAAPVDTVVATTSVGCLDGGETTRCCVCRAPGCCCECCCGFCCLTTTEPLPAPEPLDAAAFCRVALEARFACSKAWSPAGPCFLACRRRLDFWLKGFPQPGTGHRMGMGELCVRMWAFRLPRRENTLSHLEHGNGFLLVCVSKCRVRLPDSANDLPHILHE